MNNTPRCPYCGDRMELHILPHTTEQELISAWYQCVVCESTSPRLEFPGDTSNEKIEEQMSVLSKGLRYCCIVCGRGSKNFDGEHYPEVAQNYYVVRPAFKI